MNLLDRITQLAGPAVAGTIQAEFGGTTCYVPVNPLAETATNAWRAIAMQACRDMYHREMERLMVGVIGCSPEAHPEWLATVQRSTERFLALQEWIAEVHAPSRPPAKQS